MLFILAPLWGTMSIWPIRQLEDLGDEFSRASIIDTTVFLLKGFLKSIVRIVKLPKRDRRAFPMFRIQTVLLIAQLYTRSN